MTWAIGIDFGTSRSAGAIGELENVRSPTAGASLLEPSITPLEIDGNRWMPSMVVLSEDGELVVGAAAEQLAGVFPDRLDRTPKRGLGNASPLLLGGEPIDARDASAAVMETIALEGRRRMGSDPAGCVMTHPVRWAGIRLEALTDAARRAGLGDIVLVEEPVAAAVHYAAEHVAVGDHVGIYDLGGGTFDTALLQRTTTGFEVIGVPGGDEHIGGENFDHRLFRYFGECLAETHPELWDELMISDDRKWRRAALDLLGQARRAKEALSSYPSTQVFVSVADRDIVVNRNQFEEMIRDDITKTMDLMEETIEDAGLTITDLAAVFLVGGSSRIPLVAQLATERFGARVITRDEPKGVVALGAARLAALRFLRSPEPTAVASAPTTQAAPTPNAPPTTNAPPTANHGAPTASTSAAAALTNIKSKVTSIVTPYISTSAGTPSASSSSAASTAARPPTLPIVWHCDLGQPVGPLATDDQLAMVVGSATVHAVDTGTGRHLWSRSCGAVVWARPAITPTSVVVAVSDGRVVLLDRATGEVQWTQQTGSPVICAPNFNSQIIFAANDEGRVVALNAVTGAIMWHSYLGAAVRSDLLARDNVLFVACTDGQVFALDQSTGKPRWVYRAPRPVIHGIATVTGRVLVPCEDQLVYGIRMADGIPDAALRSPGRPVTAVATSDDRFAVADSAGWLRVYSVSTGRLVSDVQLGNTSALGIVMTPALPTYAFVELRRELRGIDLVKRTPRFSIPTGTGTTSVPAMAGNILCIGTNFGRLVGVQIGSGQVSST